MLVLSFGLLFLFGFSNIQYAGGKNPMEEGKSYVLQVPEKSNFQVLESKCFGGSVVRVYFTIENLGKNEFRCDTKNYSIQDEEGRNFKVGGIDCDVQPLERKQREFYCKVPDRVDITKIYFCYKDGKHEYKFKLIPQIM